MTDLCEDCFKLTEDIEILTIMPGINPCVECGRYDDRYRGGLRVHTFMSDPRKHEVVDEP